MIEHRLSELVTAALVAAADELGLSGAPPPVELSKPRLKEHGDFATNVALGLATRVGRAPREVAEVLVRNLPEAAFVASAEVAGPGFVNFRLTPTWLADALHEVALLGDGYGRAEPHGRRAQVEFVSANPTGPLHIGQGRNAALGDALARLLEASGWSVEREYYFNDTGGQMDRFGASVEARFLQLVGRQAEVPEDGYHGTYVTDLARDILRTEGHALADLPPEQRFVRMREEGTRRVLGQIEHTLERFGVRFDSYLSERSLAERGKIEAAIERLRVAGAVYEAEGAVWFRSTDHGDDKDRPLVRSNGLHTYFGADCAYLVDKFDRGFDHLVYVWGADHHGDIARVRGAAEALGYGGDRVEIVIYQWVSFLRDGVPVPMSKRAGTFVTLDELIDEVGTDAARFHLLMFGNDAAMSFDIEAVKRQSLENPVYYVQYGHARIASILRKAIERGVELRPIADADLSLLSGEAELDLLRAIADVPGQIAAAAGFRAPHSRDVAVMIGTPHVHEVVEAALELVDQVGTVGAEVRVQPVRSQERAVLVVAVVRRAEPDGALGLEDGAGSAHPLDRGLDLTAFGERALGQVRVEPHVESLQRALDLGQDAPRPLLAHALEALRRGELRKTGALLVEDLPRQVRQVRAVVAVLRHLRVAPEQLQVARLDGGAEPVHLPPGVVEVVLALHDPPGSFEQARERVTEGGVARVSYVERTRGVRAHELDLDSAPVWLRPPVALPGPRDLP